MQWSKVRSLAPLLLALTFTACDSGPDSQAPEPVPQEPAANTTPEPIVHSLAPLPGLEDVVPVITESRTVRMQTSAGEIVIDVYPEAAPNAAARFIELVESGFYDDTPVFRIVVDYIAQFGINWREPHRQWRNNTFDDDPPLFAHDRGTLSFAKAGRDTASTQVFFNYKQNNRLAEPTEQGNFAVFGKVREGMDVVDDFVIVGEPPMQLDQRRLWASGESFLESLDGQPTRIISAVVE